MRALSTLALCLIATNWLCGGEPGKGAEQSREAQRRAAERQVRASLAKGYAEARIKAQAQYLNDLAGACHWLAGAQAQAEAQKVIGDIEKVDPKFGRLPDLRKAVAGIAAPAALDDAKKKELATRIKNAAQSRVKGFLELASTCYRAGLLGLAYDLVWDIFDIDPDNLVARTAIGHVKVGDAWLSQFAAQQVQKGNKYLPELGWVPVPAVEKVQKGEWFENNRFLPLADAEKTHANLATPWVIETDAFILKSTATRKVAIEMAERLESIRALCFRQYLEFFLRGSPKRGGQLLFSQVGPQKAQKMVVHYFGKKDDFQATIMKEVKGRGQDILLNSAGFYDAALHTSFFYHDQKWGPFQVEVMQHEVTHQILGEFSHSYAPQTWLTEGVAVSLEAAEPDNHGKLAVPAGLKNPAVAEAARLLKEGALPAVIEIMGLTYHMFHQEPGRRANYDISGAICRCQLEMDDGIYAADFLEYLFDSYHGAKTNLAEYIGMDMDAFNKRFHDYLQEKQ